MNTWDKRESFLIILGCANDQIPAYKKARELGIKTIGVDYNPDAPAFDYCDLPLLVSVKHPDQLIPALEKVNNEFNFLGVMTLGVEISPMVSMVADKFGLIAVDEVTAFLTTNKCARSMRLDEQGIPIPCYQVLKDTSNIKMETPFVIKPSDSSASRGVRRVDRREDIKPAFDIAKELATDDRVLIEELLKGNEISIEGFMLNSKMYVTGFSDRNYATIPNSVSQPYFIEDGSDLPSRLPHDIQKQACKVFELAVLACGITDGPSKGDLLVQDGIVYVIEVTSRLSGGGFCSRSQGMVNGTDIVTATIQWHCGMEVDVDLVTPKYSNPVCHRFYFHEPGIITDIKGIDTIKEMPGVVHYVEQYPFTIGDELEPVCYINRLFYIYTDGDTIEEAIKNAENAIASVEITTEDSPLTFV